MAFSSYLVIIFSAGVAFSAIALFVLWLIFKLYLREYEMDFKSLIAISIKTFGTFAIISFAAWRWLPLPAGTMYPLIIATAVSFFIARRLFIKTGMENKETWRVIAPWFIIMIGIAVAATSFLLYQEGSVSDFGAEKMETVFYIKPSSANVRSCPATSCEVIAELVQNSTYTTSKYGSLDEMPEWVSIAYTDVNTGKKISGYINKVVLSGSPVE